MRILSGLFLTLLASHLSAASSASIELRATVIQELHVLQTGDNAISIYSNQPDAFSVSSSSGETRQIHESHLSFSNSGRDEQVTIETI